MKKFFWLVMMVLFLAGCGSEETKTNEPSEQEWQDSFKKIAISEAESYVQLKEKGTLSPERLESAAGVVKQQAEKITDGKESFMQLADMIKNDQLEQVKTKLNEIKGQ